jgi:hypothetical protein
MCLSTFADIACAVWIVTGGACLVAFASII